MALLPQEVIARKRDGEALSSDEIGGFVAGITSGAVNDAQAAAFAMAVFFRNMSLDERIALTLAMRDSGRVLDWSDLDGVKAYLAGPPVRSFDDLWVAPTPPAPPGPAGAPGPPRAAKCVGISCL